MHVETPPTQIPAYLQRLANQVTEKLMVDDDTIVESVSEYVDNNMDKILEAVTEKLAEAIEPMIIQEIISRYLK